jgi:hypothetical protein
MPSSRRAGCSRAVHDEPMAPGRAASVRQVLEVPPLRPPLRTDAALLGQPSASLTR